MTKKKDKKPDLSLDLIRRAVDGDDAALLTLLQRYDAEITRWATIDIPAEGGHIERRLDEDIKAEIQERYIRTIRNWRELK